jgi:hypothetical protein
MPRAFLVYWLPEQIQTAITDGLLDHAASEQFGRIASGDVLWITGKSRNEPPYHYWPTSRSRRRE